MNDFIEGSNKESIELSKKLSDISSQAMRLRVELERQKGHTQTVKDVCSLLLSGHGSASISFALIDKSYRNIKQYIRLLSFNLTFSVVMSLAGDYKYFSVIGVLASCYLCFRLYQHDKFLRSLMIEGSVDAMNFVKKAERYLKKAEKTSPDTEE